MSFYFPSGSPLNFTNVPLYTVDRLLSSMGQIVSFYREETRRRLSSSNYYSGSASGLSGAGLVRSAPRTFCEWIYYFRRRRIYFSRGRASRCRTNGHETEQNLKRERESAMERRAKDSPMNSRGNLEFGSYLPSWTHPASGDEKVSKFFCTITLRTSHPAFLRSFSPVFLSSCVFVVVLEHVPKRTCSGGKRTKKVISTQAERMHLQHHPMWSDSLAFCFSAFHLLPMQETRKFRKILPVIDETIK